MEQKKKCVFENANNRGPLYNLTNKFYNCFIPTINMWNWTPNIPNSIKMFTYASLKFSPIEIQNIDCCLIGDPSTTESELDYIANRTSAKYIILNSIDINNWNPNHELKKTIDLETLILARENAIESKTLEFVSKKIPNLKNLYVQHVNINPESKEAFSFENLEIFSCISMDVANINQIHTPNLKTLDVYNINEKYKIKNFNLKTFQQKSLKSLRIDSKILKYVPMNLIIHSKMDRLQFYGEYMKKNNFEENLKEIFTINDLILPENFPLFKEKLTKPYGIYDSNIFLEDHLDLNLDFLTIYTTKNPHQMGIIREEIIHANFNIFENMYWKKILRKISWRELKIKNEIIQMEDKKFNISPITNVKNNKEIHVSKNKNVKLRLSCTSVAVISKNVSSVLNNLDENGITIKKLILTLVGVCNNEKLLKEKLLKSTKNLNLEQRKVLENISIVFETLKF